MKPAERRKKILAMVNSKKQVKVTDLSEKLNASKETIRRDLTLLEEDNLLRKTHGFAVHIQTAKENGLTKRTVSQIQEKKAIAVAAAKLFHSGDSLFIDTGTTTIALAEEIAKMSGLLVITNSIDVADKIWHGEGNNDIYLLGGKYFGGTKENLGPLVIDQIMSMAVDYTVIGVGAISSEREIMHYDLEVASIAAAMVKQTNCSVVLADHTKFGKNAFFQVIKFKFINHLITDKKPNADILQALQTENVHLIVAENT